MMGRFLGVVALCALASPAFAQLSNQQPIQDYLDQMVPPSAGQSQADSERLNRALKSLSPGGPVLDAQTNLNLICDGSTVNTSQWPLALAKLNALTVPATVRFQSPKECIIPNGQYVFSQSVSLQATNGGGIGLPANQPLNGYLFRWNTPAPVFIDDMTFDLAGGSPAAAITTVDAILYFNGTPSHVRRSKIANVSISNASPAGLFMIAQLGASCEIQDSNFLYNGTSNQQNMTAIALGPGANTVQSCHIKHNTMVGAGVGSYFANALYVEDNDISAFGAGAGLATGQQGVAPLVAVIRGNSIHDSTLAPGSDNQNPEALELWTNGGIIEGNNIRNICGKGIAVGSNNIITGNKIRNVGKCKSGGIEQTGIVGYVQTSNSVTYSATGSTIADNDVSDDQAPGSQTTQYGYADTGGPSVTVGFNIFQGLLGSYNVQGNATFGAASADNRFVNPCFRLNQRDTGYTTASTGGTWVGDQWKFFSPSGVQAYGLSAVPVGACRNGSASFNVTASASPSAGDVRTLQQNIRAGDLRDIWVSGGSFVVEFAAQQSVALTQSLFVYNPASGRSFVYPLTFQNQPGTGETFSVRVPVDTTALNTNDAAVGLTIGLNMGSGSNYQTSNTGAWQSGTYYAATTDTPLVAQPNNTIEYVGAFRLSTSSNGWIPPGPDADLYNAERFFASSFPAGTYVGAAQGLTGSLTAINQAANGQPSITFQFPRPMNTTPALNTYNPISGNSYWRDTTTNTDFAPTISGLTNTGAAISAVPVSNAGDVLRIQEAADAGL